VALFFLWARRESFPALTGRLAWGGLVLVGLSVLVRIVGSLFFIDSLAAWSLPIWVGGVAWLFGGPAVFRWALPAIAFLWFMTPLPFRAEHLLSHPMQRVATSMSCWMLQSLGQPAVAEGNVIFIEEEQLEVAEACSGLRMLVSITALAYAYSVLVQRRWWVTLLLFLSVMPVALMANSLRITATGLVYRYFPGEEARHFAHDAAGWLMIPIAAALMGLFLWYLGRLFVDVRRTHTGDLLRRGGLATGN